jgi:cytochrome P450
MHILTMPVAATSYEPVQIYESERLLYDLLREPARYEELFERYAGAVIMRLAYAKTIESDNDPHIRRALEVVHTVERVASPGSYLVDTFPFLMYLPTWCSPFKKEAERLHQRELTFFRDLMEEVRVSMKRPACPPSFMRTFLERQEEFRLTDDEGAYVIGTLFEAGSGTTAAAMMSFCLAMCHYPDWQRTLQEEVDSVVGDDRLPAFSDMPSLPVVRAVVKEVLRWRPVTAGGVPHQLIKDDTYQGFYFPAGTVVHANQWYVNSMDSRSKRNWNWNG